MRKTMTSSKTMSPGETSTSLPSRRTTGLASPITDNLASVREARHSWKMPIPVLATITNPKRESWNGAINSITIHNEPIRKLNQVSVFSRMMLRRLREVAVITTFTSPRDTRWATSAAVSPTAGSVIGRDVMRVARPCGAGSRLHEVPRGRWTAHPPRAVPSRPQQLWLRREVAAHVPRKPRATSRAHSPILH